MDIALAIMVVLGIAFFSRPRDDDDETMFPPPSQPPVHGPNDPPKPSNK